MPFNAPRLKIKRADKHISELNSVFERFIQTDFHELVIKDDANTGKDVLQFRMLKTLPEDMPTIIGDAVHNLRSALDLLICKSVAVTHPNQSLRYVHFPFGTDITREEFIKRFENEIVHKCLSAELWGDIVDVIQPYKGGNRAFCALHELDILDKHELLIPMLHIAALTDVHIEDETGAFVIKGTLSIQFSNPGGVPVGWSTAFAKRDKIHIYDKGKPTGDILFHEGLVPLESQSIIPTLKQLSELVLGIVERFEAVCFRQS